jgi:ADP-ribosylglycohydrolase
MLGALAGDIVGSDYEGRPIKTKNFPLFRPGCQFTDDTVMTVATAWAILEGKDYRTAYQRFGRRYPGAGYGTAFLQWIFTPDPLPYNSWGNGAAMRVSPIGFAFDTEEEVLHEAARSAGVSHNHPEGIRGAQAVALAVWLARKEKDKAAIKERIEKKFGYDLSIPLEKVRATYTFDVSCQGTVPYALRAFLEAESVEEAIRNAVSLGGDSDTLACIAGGVAHAYFGKLSEELLAEVRQRLTTELWEITLNFCRRFGISI